MLGLTRWKDGRGDDHLPGGRRPARRPGAARCCPAPSGEVWVGTERGLARWRDGQIDRPLPLTDPVTALYVDRARATLWIGGTGSAGLVRRPSALTRLSLVGRRPELPVGEIRGMQHDDQGVLWASARRAAVRVDGEQLRPRSRAGRAAVSGRCARCTATTTARCGWAPPTGWSAGAAGAGACSAATAGLPARGSVPGGVRRPRASCGPAPATGILRIDSARAGGSRRPRAGPVLSFETTDQRREVAATRTRQPGAWKGARRPAVVRHRRGVVSVDPERGCAVNALPPPVRIEQALVDGRPARRGQREPLPARLGRAGVPLRRHHPARAAQGPAPLPAGGLRRRLGRGGHPAGGLLHQHARRATTASGCRGATPTGSGTQAGDSLALTPGAALPPDRLVLRAGARWRCWGWRWSFYRMRVAQLHGALRRHRRRAQPGGPRAARFAAAGDGGGADAPEGPAQALPARRRPPPPETVSQELQRDRGAGGGQHRGDPAGRSGTCASSQGQQPRRWPRRWSSWSRSWSPARRWCAGGGGGHARARCPATSAAGAAAHRPGGDRATRSTTRRPATSRSSLTTPEASGLTLRCATTGGASTPARRRGRRRALRPDWACASAPPRLGEFDDRQPAGPGHPRWRSHVAARPGSCAEA